MNHDALEKSRSGVLPGASDSQSEVRSQASLPASQPAPAIPDHELLKKIGGGSYGEVWLARNVLGEFRAVKVIYRARFEHERPYEREFEGIQKFEPISRLHESQVDILHVGRNVEAGYFYYVMELADDVGAVSSLKFQVSGSDAPEAGQLETGNLKLIHLTPSSSTSTAAVGCRWTIASASAWR